MAQDPTVVAARRARRRPRRETAVVVGALVLLSAFAWAYTAGMDAGNLAHGVLTRQARMSANTDSMAMGAARWGWPTIAFLAMWTVMMVAMMFPATSPVVLVFDRWRKSRDRTPAATIAFIAGYLAVWCAAGLLAYALIVALDSSFEATPVAQRVGGSILLAAGAYQVSPMKAACLTQCRSPLSLIMKHAQQLGNGLVGPLRVGLSHGAYCLGCCWALMVVLVALGAMNVGWMAGVSALILAEKVLPHPRVTTYVIAAGLALAGAAVLATAG